MQLTKLENLKTSSKGNFMKAIVISSLLFFSLRAMAAEVGEDKKGVCTASVQTSTRSAKIVVADTSTSVDKPAATKTTSK